jgi:hypothetical protein
MPIGHTPVIVRPHHRRSEIDPARFRRRSPCVVIIPTGNACRVRESPHVRAGPGGCGRTGTAAVANVTKITIGHFGNAVMPGHGFVTIGNGACIPSVVNAEIDSGQAV